MPSRKELSLDEFQVISEWYHSAILELTKIRGFRTDTRWIAKQLDLSPEHVNIAIQRLLRLGFLEMKRREEWLDRSPGVVVPMEVLPEPAQKNIYKQAHELSHLLIEKSPMGAQLHGHAVLALGREQLPEILDLYERFQEKLSKLIEAHPQKDAVYQLIFSLCPLTRPNEEANKKENKEKHLE